MARKSVTAAGENSDEPQLPARSQTQEPIYTLGQLIADLEGSEQLKPLVAEKYKREMETWGAIAADGYLMRQNVYGGFRANPKTMPGIERIEHHCDAEFAGTGLTSTSVRQLRVNVCKKLKLPGWIACVNELSLNEVADVLEDIQRIPFEVFREMLVNGVSTKTASVTDNLNETKKKRRGRPVDTDLKADAKMFDGWKTGQYLNVEDLARAFDTTKYEAQKTIDREAKRRKRADKPKK
jgi:hypothetical protein